LKGISPFKLPSPIISEMVHEIEKDISAILEQGDAPTKAGRMYRRVRIDSDSESVVTDAYKPGIFTVQQKKWIEYAKVGLRSPEEIASTTLNLEALDQAEKTRSKMKHVRGRDSGDVKIY